MPGGEKAARQCRERMVIFLAVTAKQISELAGVSRGTVDRVLNNRGKVRPETQQKVWKIANELGYKPNRVGKALATIKKKLSIGVIIMSQGNEFFDDVIEGIHDAAKDLDGFGVRVALRTMKGFDVDKQLEIICELEQSNINALAIVPINDPKIAKKLNELAEKKITVVTINSDIEGARRLAYIGSNYVKGGETACGLMGLFMGGKANVGVVTGSLKMLGHNQRIYGFSKVMKERFPHMQVVDIVQNNDDEFESFDVVKTLLVEHPEIDALFLAAAGVYGACRAVKSLSPERNITIISFDDIKHTKQLVRDGTIAATICQQPWTQGSNAIKILFNYMVDKVTPSSDCIYTQAEIKIRENI